MSSNSARAETLARALSGSLSGDPQSIASLFTDDVQAWAPGMNASSRAELLAEFDRRDDVFSDFDLVVIPLDVGGDYACAEWTVAMKHAGALTVRAGEAVEPTGETIVLHGITVAEFRGEQICSLRQYWDELDVYDQLGLLADD